MGDGDGDGDGRSGLLLAGYGEGHHQLDLCESACVDGCLIAIREATVGWVGIGGYADHRAHEGVTSRKRVEGEVKVAMDAPINQQELCMAWMKVGASWMQAHRNGVRFSTAWTWTWKCRGKARSRSREHVCNVTTYIYLAHQDSISSSIIGIIIIIIIIIRMVVEEA